MSTPLAHPLCDYGPEEIALGRATLHSDQIGTAARIYACAGGLAFRVFTIALALLWPRTSAGSDQTPYLIEDFEGPTALQSWRFYSVPESDATGALALGPGHRAHGAVLAYRLPCDRQTQCEAYAAALWTAASPLPARRDPAISLWIRFPPDVEVSLLAKGTSGRMLRFPIRATIEHIKAGDWQYVVVPLSVRPTADPAQDSPTRIKGRLVEIGILVQARSRALVQGSVSFDDVRLLDASATFHIDATSQAEPPSQESWRLPPRLGVNIHLLRDDHALDLARAAGFGFVRIDMLWANVERNGRYRWQPYDALLRALESRGMSVLWILDYGHPDHGGGVPRTLRDIAAFGQFAEAAAAYFKGRNVQYEIWNEPNLSQFWAPSPNASEYAALLREATAAIHRADPSAKVSSGGVSRIDEAFLNRTLDPRLATELTAIGIHPYRKTGPETVAPELESLRYRIGNTFGDRLEIWDTEWGYSSADALKDVPSNGHADRARRRQAALAVREILTVWAVGFPLAVWYDLRDDGPDAANPEHNYGLLDSGGNEKPAMKAIRTFTGLVGGHRYAGMVGATAPGLHAMRWDGSTDTILVVWNDQPGVRRPVAYTKRGLISATDITGQPIKSKDVPSGKAQVQIDETAGPIYLRWTASPDALAQETEAGHAIGRLRPSVPSRAVQRGNTMILRLPLKFRNNLNLGERLLHPGALSKL